MKLKLTLFALMSLFICNTTKAQRAAISTNLVELSVLTPNLSYEVIISPSMSCRFSFAHTPFDNIYSEIKYRCQSTSVEVRHWLKRPLYSHFFGAGIYGSNYDVKYKNFEYKGALLSLGVSYGYGIAISPRWALTPSIGVGYGYNKYFQDSGSFAPEQIRTRFIPCITQLNINLSYIIG